MPGLLDFLSPSGGLGAQGGFMDRASSFRDQNPGVLSALGAGIAAGNMPEAWKGATMMRIPAQRANQTAQFLMKRGFAKDPEEAMAIANQPALLNLVMKDPDQYEQRAVAAERYGLQKGSPEFNNYVLGTKSGGAVDYSQIPQYYKRKDGTYGIGVLGDNGTFKEVDLGGAEPLGPMGTSLDRAEGTALGKDRGENKALLESSRAKMPGLKATVNELNKLSEQATYTPAGQLIDTGRRWMDMEPSEGAVARTKYMAIVDNQVLPLLRDTFGAQFTVQEGESLRATLGAPDKTPTEKKAVLEAFIKQKERNIEALAAQTGETIPPPPSGLGGNTRLRFNPATGELE